MIHMVETETKVPMISALCHPYVRAVVDPLYASVSALMEMPNPSMSDARCAESAKIAIDPAKYPPIS